MITTRRHKTVQKLVLQLDPTLLQQQQQQQQERTTTYISTLPAAQD
jgi:hypothetical protein